MDGEQQLTVIDLVNGVLPCIEAKHYSDNYVNGFRGIFNRLTSFCANHGEVYFSAELAQQFLLECYGVQPGTVERRCSRAHRAMDLLSDYQHFGTVMIRRRLNRAFPVAFVAASEGYLRQMELRGRRKNTVRSHKKVLLRFADFLDSTGVTGFASLTPETVNLFIKVVLCNYSNAVAMEYYGILRRFLQYLAQSGNTIEDLSLRLVPVKRVFKLPIPWEHENH